MRESQFQRELTEELKKLFPGCIVLKNDANYLQGIPDWLVLFQDRWAMLEVKAEADSPKQPNQDYYVELLDDMSFAAFVHPGNKEDVIRDLQFAFRPNRPARVSKR